LVVVLQLQSFLVGPVVQHPLLHHVSIVFPQDVLYLSEVLSPSESEVLPCHCGTALHEFLLEMHASFEGAVLVRIVLGVEERGLASSGRESAVATGVRNMG
jgi:hypothetical protein